MRFNFKFAFLALVVVALVVAFSTISFSVRSTWRQFLLTVPSEVSGYPGDTITIDGEVFNFGWWWLHDFNLTLSGLPENYEYEFNPQHWDHLMIIRVWDSENGTYKVPEKFTLTIKIPEGAAGEYTVNITGQEFMSWQKSSNSTTFALKVTSLANFTVTNLVIPQTATEGEPFDISMNVNNIGQSAGAIDVSVKIPSDWTAEEERKSLTIDANSSQNVVFTITPTKTSGQIQVFALYPYMKEIVNITKVGNMLIPKEKATATTVPQTGLEALVEQIDGYTPIVAGVAVLVVVLVAWKIASNVKFRVVKGKEEKFIQTEL